MISSLVLLSAAVICNLDTSGEADHPERYPWATVNRTILPKKSEKFDGMEKWRWTDTGGANGKVTALEDGIKWEIAVRKTPDWPSITLLPDPKVDFKGGVLRFRLRAFRKGGGACPVRVIMNGADQTHHVALTPTPIGDGKWRTYDFDPGDGTWQRQVHKIHFFVSTDQYTMGEDFSYEFDGFRRGVAKREFVPMPKGQAGVSLWLGRRADADDSMVLVREGEGKMRALLHVENNLGKALTPKDVVRFRLRNVFAQRDTVVDVPFGASLADGTKGSVGLDVDVSQLKGGYYHALADVLVDGKSVVGIRKGSDDFYVRRAGESDAETVMAIRLGMTNWIIDRVHGGGLQYTRIALPHTYDPYDATAASYSKFIRLFAPVTSKVGEGYEAGLSGLAIAAEAYRRSGDAERESAAERLIWNCCEAMFTMQDACGGCLTLVNDLHDIDGYGSSDPGEKHNAQYHADQTGEWMRALTYAGGYYLRKGETAKLRDLLARIRKAGAFLVENCRQDSDGIAGALRDFKIRLNADGSFTRTPYVQEGRQCDVYQPRLVAGLAYAAGLMQKAGEEVPSAWWSAFDATVRWMGQKMKADGWFDWQCGDYVENGCHTFLGNIYAGEALFGIGMADRIGGRGDAAAAFEAARKAYHYVTDSCVVRGVRYKAYPEFWTGPYLYWLFSDWQANVGHDETFAAWLATLDRTWRVEREWKDFLRTPGYDCGRARHNGMINIAILGYLGIRVMEDHGQTWKLFDEGPLASPESQGVSSRQILEWIRACEKPGFCIHGFVIRRHGRVIAEGSWAPFDTLNRPHTLWSHSKTFTATAIGFLADEGKLDLDERVIRILPDKAPASPSENLRQLRVRDVLTMNMGAGHTNAMNDDPAGDWEKALLATKYGDPPGTRFRYDSGATYLLSAIVGRKSGKTTMDYLREKLFSPLGMRSAWSTTSPSGTPCGGWGMRMTTRDIAKFGQLMLDRGVWQGHRLLSTRWVDLASTYQTASHTNAGDDSALGYGFQCWRSRHGYRADGAFGQFTLILPELDAVISLHAAQQDQRDELKLVWNALLPAFREGTLPEDAASCAALREACRTLAFRVPQGQAGKADARLFGVTYAVEKNRHISAVRLAEAGEGWRMTLVTPAGEHTIPVGRGAYAKGRLKFTNAPHELTYELWGDLDVAAAGAVGADGSLSVEVHPLDHTSRLALKAYVHGGVPRLSGEILAFADRVINGTAR